MNRPGPAASCTTRASIATCTGWRVNGEMIPQPTARRSVSRAISAETTVDERASIPCLRHHGYASASQIVSMPAASIARAEASISSSGSIVSCITPMRNGTAMTPLLLLVELLGRQRAYAVFCAARAARRIRIEIGLGRLAVVVELRLLAIPAHLAPASPARRGRAEPAG